MRFCWLLLGIGAFVMIAESAWTKDASQSGRGAVSSAAADSPDAAAIKKGEEAFKAAFDAGDARAVAALWTADGELVEEGGERLEGARLSKNAIRLSSRPIPSSASRSACRASVFPIRKRPSRTGRQPFRPPAASQ